MLEKFLEEYIDDLYKKQNIGLDNEQKDLYSKADVYKILKPVIKIIASNKDCSIKEFREKIYNESKIEDKVKDFIYKKEMVPGMVFSYGTKNFKETVVIGNKQEVTLDKSGNLVPELEKMTEDTIFDLASITKLFTSLSILKLLELETIKLDDPITKYAPQFKNLFNVSIFDLLSFKVPLKTNKRVDLVNNKQEAENVLFDIEVDYDNNGKVPYSDMGAMVLKYIVEKISGISFYQFLEENILNKLKLKDTHVSIPNSKIDRVASTNFVGKYFKDGNVVMLDNINKGVVNDPKAQVMGQSAGNLSGHAGLFSTNKDMVGLAKAMIGGQIIDKEYIKSMSKNKTGRVFSTKENGEKDYVQYLVYLCSSKNPILENSELFHALSGQSIASAGWTGTQFTVDPINELFFFMGSNRTHNRMVYIDSAQRDKVQVDENKKKTIVLPNGETKIDSTRFAWDRDEVVVHPALKLAIQYQFLEKIYSYEKEAITNAYNTRVI